LEEHDKNKKGKHIKGYDTEEKKEDTHHVRLFLPLVKVFKAYHENELNFLALHDINRKYDK